MRKCLLMILVLSVFLLGTTTLTRAGVVTWTVLEGSLAAGRGPGADELIGVPGCSGVADNDDTTTGEENTCNLSNDLNCRTGSTPLNGSYSYGVTEYVMAKSCLGGTNAGGSCLVAGDCPGGTCTVCTDNPGWDVYMFMGKVGGVNGTMTVCQEGSVATTTAMKMGMSEPSAGLGPMCSTLSPGGPYTADHCGVDVLSTSTVDMTSKIFTCTTPVGTMDGISSTGRSLDVNDATPTPTCGYSAADIACFQTAAKAKGATYISIACSEQVMPASETVCITGATNKSVIISWTKDNPSDCTSACSSGGCLMSTAEEVE